MESRMMSFRIKPSATDMAVEAEYANYRQTAEDKAEIAAFFAELKTAKVARDRAIRIESTDTVAIRVRS